MDFVLRSVALNLAYSVAKSLATKRDKQKRPTTHERGTLAGKIKNPTATSATSVRSRRRFGTNWTRLEKKEELRDEELVVRLVWRERRESGWVGGKIPFAQYRKHYLLKFVISLLIYFILNFNNFVTVFICFISFCLLLVP